MCDVLEACNAADAEDVLIVRAGGGQGEAIADALASLQGPVRIVNADVPAVRVDELRALTAAGVVGALLGRRSKVMSVLSGAALLAASVATRFGIFEGGIASAADPRYTVVPQRERLDRITRTPSTPVTAAPERAPAQD